MNAHFSLIINLLKPFRLLQSIEQSSLCYTVDPESPLDCKEIQPVHSEGDQPWDFFGRNDAKAEIPVLWPPHGKSWLIRKDSDAGRDWGQEEKGTTEDEMVGWHRWFDGRESEWTPGVGDGQGCLVCWDSWGGKESDTTERLIWSDGGPLVKNLPVNAGDTGDWGSVPGWGKIPWCRQQQPTPVFLLGNPKDRGAW